MKLQGKEYYDFKLTLDLLYLSKGVAGVAFRVQNDFNYYCFIIDKNQGFKAIGKVINGKLTILKKIEDGGILINDWHSVIITVQGTKITVYMYDKETASKAVSEKTLEVRDSTFVRGSASVFINGVKGFCFDSFSIVPLKCWSPWQPKDSVSIKNLNTNIFVEDFKGTIIEKYFIVDIDESTSREGPASWMITYEDSILGSFITQTTMVFDSSSMKKPSFIALKGKNFCNGIYRVFFEPLLERGTVSIIFKYSKQVSKTGSIKEEFYSFDITNSFNEFTFKLRRWNNGDVKILNSLNASQVPGLKKAFIPKKNNIVEIEYINDRVTIRMNQDGMKFQDIFTVVEETIKCGTVGFGTSNLIVRFSGVYLEALKLKLTIGDIDMVLNKSFDSLPFPSVRRIRKIAEKTQSILIRLIKNNSALAYLLSQISLTGSSLGFNFKSVVRESLSLNVNVNINSSSSTSVSKTEFGNGNQWKVCIMSRSFDVRKKYCQQKHNNSELEQKCEVILLLNK